ncbi:ParB-like protein [Plantibacter sp. YIM 135347]|uniref:ParB-like protein n=1 Tax=Plantibacter sp. YIM 135347 TaxID=3423919 RepID=UPI003D32608E
MTVNPSVRRASWSALVVALLAGASLASAGVVQAAPLVADAAPAPDYLNAKAGDLVDVRIGDVLPTQPSLGYDEVYYKLGRYTLGKDAINKKFDDWCEANGQVQAASATAASTLADPASFTCTVPVGSETVDSIAPMKTVVIGPGGALYLTDGHHTLTSFFETPDGGPNLHVRLRVLGNLSALDTATFWTTMAANKWDWLRDVQGNPITPDQLPKSVGLANFQNDPYRSLLYFGRDIGYSAGSLPFQEFYWGSWIRDAKPIDLGTWNSNDLASYIATVKAMTQKQTSIDPATVIDSGFTAADLGALQAWNDGKAATKGEFAKLSAPYSEAKPGKLAYALAYKATLPVATVPATPAAPTATANGSTVSVSWTAPADGGSAISGYTLSLNGASPVAVGANVTSHDFTNLATGPYAVTVTAINAIGSSAPSAASAPVIVAPAPVDPGTVKGSIQVTGSLRAGGSITVTGAGFATSTKGFAVEIHSAPQHIGTADTDAQGRFTLRATIPASTPAGTHSIVVLINGTEVSSSDITIAADPTATPGPTASATPVASGATSGLASTGFDGVGAVWIGIAFLVAGAGTVLVLRRRERAER